MLQKVGLQCDNAMLNLSVALHAKTYQIAKIVCLHIVVVFAGDVVKGSKRGYVVNIKSLAVLLLSCATHATGVVVALAGKALLTMPVWAVILDHSTFPVGRGRAGHEISQPLVLAVLAAKMDFALSRANSGGIALNWFSARSAVSLYRFCPVRIIFPAHVRFAPFIPAIATAKEVIVAPYFGGIALDLLAALRTLHLYLSAFVGWRGGSNLSGLPRATTSTVAEMQRLPLQPPLWAIDFLATAVALDQNSVGGWHKKTPCRRVSWNACRGRATADRRQCKLYHCGIPTNNCNTLDIGNYTTSAGAYQ